MKEKSCVTCASNELCILAGVCRESGSCEDYEYQADRADSRS